ncbi:unnamed protein product [Sphagnum troendelagicum]|uniref:Uncharacterized protein n=1 Tax=Sphagnum troendelagicum TaxID=128251 RepID=A0ABP0UGV2_9BRYO
MPGNPMLTQFMSSICSTSSSWTPTSDSISSVSVFSSTSGFVNRYWAFSSMMQSRLTEPEDLMCHENSKPQPRGLLIRSVVIVTTADEVKSLQAPTGVDASPKHVALLTAGGNTMMLHHWQK